MSKGKFVICAYLSNGELVAQYDSVKEAASSIHASPRSIHKCLKVERATLHKKRWRKFEVGKVIDHIEKYTETVSTRSIKPIAKIDKNNKVSKTYPSIRSASILERTDAHTIRDVLSGKCKLANGNRYRYLTDEEIEKYGYQKGSLISVKKTPIIQYSLDGKYIKTYSSISEACKALGKEKRNQEIRNCLNGKYRSAFNYIWRYKDKPNIKMKRQPKVVQIDISSYKVINKYNSVKEASTTTNISVSSINNCIRGRQKTAGGYIWKKQ